MKVGVLALQGDVREHFRALEACDVNPIAVRRRQEIEDIDALIIPGGESTTIAHLAQTFDVFDLIQKRIRAGMILLADRVVDAIEGQRTFGGLDMTVRRNAFGRQIDSFESDIEVSGISAPTMRAVFIRAPWVEDVGAQVEVLASVRAPDGRDHAVAVRQGALLATSFHPELTGDNRIHSFFVRQVCNTSISIK